MDLIDRQKTIEMLEGMKVKDPFDRYEKQNIGLDWAIDAIKAASAVQPFHNTTMNEVLEYIDGMPEDEWQEFTACLECRGWELQRRTAKWCGGDFA